MVASLLPAAPAALPAITWAFDYFNGVECVFVRWLDVEDRVRREHLAVDLDDGDLVLAQGALDDVTYRELTEDVAEYYSEGATRFQVVHAGSVAL